MVNSAKHFAEFGYSNQIGIFRKSCLVVTSVFHFAHLSIQNYCQWQMKSVVVLRFHNAVDSISDCLPCLRDFFRLFYRKERDFVEGNKRFSASPYSQCPQLSTLFHLIPFHEPDLAFTQPKNPEFPPNFPPTSKFLFKHAILNKRSGGGTFRGSVPTKCRFY